MTKLKQFFQNLVNRFKGLFKTTSEVKATPVPTPSVASTVAAPGPVSGPVPAPTPEPEPFDMTQALFNDQNKPQVAPTKPRTPDRDHLNSGEVLFNVHFKAGVTQTFGFDATRDGRCELYVTEQPGSDDLANIKITIGTTSAMGNGRLAQLEGYIPKGHWEFEVVSDKDTIQAVEYQYGFPIHRR